MLFVSLIFDFNKLMLKKDQEDKGHKKHKIPNQPKR